MQQFSYPTDAEIHEIQQDLLPRLMADRPIFKSFGLKPVESYRVDWEQKDNYYGLQALRGLDGEPPRVNAVGFARYSMAPGIYGEYAPVEEADLTVRRSIGTFADSINITDLVMDRVAMLQQRFLDRVEYALWQSAQGSYTVLGRGGKIMYADKYPVQTFSAVTSWSNSGSSTPLADMRQVKLLGRGHSVSFGSDAELWMNQKTANNLMNNTNPSDLYQRRPTGLSTVIGIAQVNLVFQLEDLPQVRVYDEGYLADPATIGAPATAALYTPYIPDNTAILIGKRPANAMVGNYLLCRNANNPALGPGQYTKVIDTIDREVPRKIEVHNGHNGGPGIEYPSAIVVLNV